MIFSLGWSGACVSFVFRYRIIMLWVFLLSIVEPALKYCLSKQCYFRAKAAQPSERISCLSNGTFFIFNTQFLKQRAANFRRRNWFPFSCAYLQSSCYLITFALLHVAPGRRHVFFKGGDETCSPCNPFLAGGGKTHRKIPGFVLLPCLRARPVQILKRLVTSKVVNS